MKKLFNNFFPNFLLIMFAIETIFLKNRMESKDYLEWAVFIIILILVKLYEIQQTMSEGQNHSMTVQILKTTVEEVEKSVKSEDSNKNVAEESQF